MKDGVAQRRLDADRGRSAGKDERLDPARREQSVQLGVGETAEAPLYDDEILGQRRELGHDFCPAAALCQAVADRVHHLPRPRSRPSGVRHVGAKLALDVHHNHARGTGDG